MVLTCMNGCFIFARQIFVAARPGKVTDRTSEDANANLAGMIDADDVRPAMTGVYIDNDVLLRPIQLAAKQNSNSPKSFSAVPGAGGLPNSSQSFFEARNEAAQKREWLVVNLQHPDNMDSEKLNANVWSNSRFSNDIFVNKAKLWQRDVCHSEAKQFIIYYYSGAAPRAEECPLVIIIDPRTGRALRRWRAGSEDFPLDHKEALRCMNTFLEMHTLEGFSPPESPQSSPAAGPQISEPDVPEISLEELDEAAVAKLGDEVTRSDSGESNPCGFGWNIVETSSSGSERSTNQF